MVKEYFCRLSCLCTLLALPIAASTTRIWIPNQGGTTIDVIDPVTNKVVQTIKGFGVPYGVNFSPDGRRAYVTDLSDHNLDIVDTQTGEIMKKVHLSGNPNTMVVTKDGKRVFISINPDTDIDPKHKDAGVGAVDIVDATSLERIKSIPMKGSIHDMDMTPDGKFAVAGSYDKKYPHLVVIDLQTEQPVWEVRFEKGVLTHVEGIGRDGSADRSFVELEGFDGFAVVDFESRKEVDRIKLPVGKFNSQPGFDNPTHGTAITPDGKALWVGHRGSNNVYVFSLPDLKLVGQVYMPQLEVPGKPVQGGDPHWIAFTPDGKTAYVPMSALGLVAAVDAKTRKVVARIPVGKNPRRAVTLVTP